MNFHVVLSIWLFIFLTSITAQSQTTSDARALDALLQDYAFRAFVRPRTGVVYDGVVPSNLTGTRISGVRLRSGSLRTRGVTFNEYEIPTGVVEQPYVERLVLVYQNLGNWSMTYYPLQGYSYLAPVLGLLAYDATDLSAQNLPELDIRASDQPISIRFSNLRSIPDGLVPQCVLFDLNGSVNFSNVVSGNICTTFRQGHFAIVVESIAPVPSPVGPPRPGGAPSEGPVPSGARHNNRSRVWIIVGSVLGGLALLVLLGLLVLWVRKYRHRKKMEKMERAAEFGEALHMTSVGNTKAPAAMGTRTQPTLETEYVP
ncbi:hypothetical protein ACJIZ3_024511 [Penstemon smallii]|uniref:Transmembrane protein n=1 Tax=Penstemon smallii TaxID=265156 RepID=A0ABD3TUJ1_9LAMI